MTIAENIAARERHTASLLHAGQGGATQAPMTAGEATETLFGWVYKQPGMATLADCREVLHRLAGERGQDDATMLLQRFGCQRVDDLFIGCYSGLVSAAKTALYYGVSPGYAWTEPIPDDVRDRWLLSHPESDCLWEVRGRLADELGDGHVDDVSGVTEWEERFAAQQSGNDTGPTNRPRENTC